MNLKKLRFGAHKGQDIDLFIMENDLGMRVRIMNYGATVTSIEVPGNDGSRIDLVCGFDTFDEYFSEPYKNNAPYFGCTVGRTASVIKDAKFTIEGKEYKITPNMAPHHLHGGAEGFDKKVWKSETIEGGEAVGVKMSLNSPHLEEGYPGNLDVSVRFILTNDNELKIDYEAETDQLTPISMTNHTYFNLSGFQENLENHRATVMAGSYLAPDDEGGITDGKIAKVEGGAEDLREGKFFKDIFRDLEFGFEHYFIFDKPLGTKDKVAEFEHTGSGRKLEIFTTEPGMLFYTGRYTSDDLKRENGDRYGQFRAFCCETHRYQNGPNIESPPGTLTGPTEKYEQSTVFKLSW
ncbi:aldose epimerase family protein [Bacteroidota bacterium]